MDTTDRELREVGSLVPKVPKSGEKGMRGRPFERSFRKPVVVMRRVEEVIYVITDVVSDDRAVTVLDAEPPQSSVQDVVDTDKILVDGEEVALVSVSRLIAPTGKRWLLWTTSSSGMRSRRRDEKGLVEPMPKARLGWSLTGTFNDRSSVRSRALRADSIIATCRNRLSGLIPIKQFFR